jgi:hypothetical protein
MNDDVNADWIDQLLSDESDDTSTLFDDDHDAHFAEDYGVNGYE